MEHLLQFCEMLVSIKWTNSFVKKEVIHFFIIGLLKTFIMGTRNFQEELVAPSWVFLFPFFKPQTLSLMEYLMIFQAIAKDAHLDRRN